MNNLRQWILQQQNYHSQCLIIVPASTLQKLLFRRKPSTKMSFYVFYALTPTSAVAESGGFLCDNER
ncbi:MAG: hypothetical protein ACI8VC_002580 [Candidatus Endobugula sp.]|jgi:hypothetical protein